jgi:uncharacterized damage-inducible protein DinB
VQLTPEQFTEQVSGSYGSVRNTLVHIMSTEWGWVHVSTPSTFQQLRRSQNSGRALKHT